MDAYDFETKIYLREGQFLLQAARMGVTDDDHCKNFQRYARLPKGTIIDMGAGTGEMAIRLGNIIPAQFVCVTSSRFQRDLIQRRGVPAVQSDYHSVPLPDGAADGVIFSESFGYGDESRLLKEAHRLLKPGGVLVVKDFQINSHPHDPCWKYEFRTEQFTEAMDSAGFAAEKIRFPFTTEEFRDFWEGCELRALHPPEWLKYNPPEDYAAIWRGVKR